MPAVSEPPPLPARFRPFGVRLAGWLFGIALFVVGAAVWVAFPQEARDAFTTLQRVTVIGMFLGTVAIGHALGRSRVDAHDSGLRVVNGYRTYEFTWEQVVALRLRPGNPWATLDRSDGTTVSVMGIQGSDGERARRQVRQLRALIASHSAQEPGG
jgi:hypothetical protein